jgi:predicted naringenin-chalcone synthase
MNQGHRTSPVRIRSIGTAVPETEFGQAEAVEVLLGRYGDRLDRRHRDITEKVFRHPSIRKRHFAFNNPGQVFDEDPDERVERFTRSAIDLGTRACRSALETARKNPGDVSALVVNTCTGYLCPGLSSYLLEDLPLSSETPVYDLVGHGCGAALPNLEVGSRLVGDGGVVLSLAVEICSATFRMENDIGLIVSNAIFADGAAAAVLSKGSAGLALIDSNRLISPEHREEIRYVYRDGRLFNQLSQRLPDTVKALAPPLVQALLDRHELDGKAIRHWAIHPGGHKVVTALQEGLALSDEQVRVSREILSEYGNMSSPTVLFGLERIMRNGIGNGEWCVMIGMGAGMSIHVWLLRR